ncbi:hypothetical protein Q3G72_016394 [Acer saccharum]|nr:hypothetical protein Q3G72_016394 [Acer saccharum]
MVRSVSLKRANLFLRQNRRWPHSPYKTRWHQTFNQQQAIEILKKSLLLPPPTQPQQNSNQPHLLSSLLHSFSIYNCDPTPQAYLFVIKTLAKTSKFNQIHSVLDHIEKNENLEIPESIFVDIIKIYADADRIQEAVCLFYRIPKFRCVPSVYSLNTLLSVVCRNIECTKMVPKILLQSQLMKIRIEQSSFRVLIGCLCRMNRVGFAIEILNCMINDIDGFVVDAKTFSLLLSSVCEPKNDLPGVEVLGFLQELKRLGFCPGMADYTNVIRYLVKMEKGLDALSVLDQMKSDGIKPDVVCYTMVLSRVIAEEDYAKAEKLFDELLVLGLVPDVYTYNVYINGLCKQNKVEAGIKMVACMEELRCKPNAITYNTILQALYKVGEESRSRELVKEMRLNGIAPNLQTYNIMIGGLVSKGEIAEACSLLKEVLDNRSRPPSFMFDETLCELCYKGKVSEVLEMLKEMADKNVSPGARVWEALLLSSGSKLDFTDTSLIDLVDPVSCQNDIFYRYLTEL